jgi:hypothetical protein
MKYIVWINEDRQGWEPNGDGGMTQKQAERCAQEINRLCPGTRAKALPADQIPAGFQR